LCEGRNLCDQNHKSQEENRRDEIR
jgi:hypothetical protein